MQGKSRTTGTRFGSYGPNLAIQRSTCCATFDFCVTVSVNIERIIVFQVIILHSEQSNTTTHVHFIIATCCDLTLGRHQAIFNNTENLDLSSVRQFYISSFIFVYNLNALMLTYG